MPLDALTVACLRKELAPVLIGGKIEKVQQPASDTLLLSLRTPSQGAVKLLIGSGSGTARVHLTTESYENPAQPPVFCMLMRKYLTGARILELTQPGTERMLELRLSAFNEMGEAFEEQLEVELIGSASNITLVGPGGRIVDCIRRYGSLDSETRCMLPGMIYEFPRAQNKVPFLTAEPGTIHDLVLHAAQDRPVDKWLLNTFAGLSPAVCREMAFRSGNDPNDLADRLDALQESVLAGECTPTLILQDGKPMDFSCMALTQYGETVQSEACESFSRMLELFYTQRSKAENLKRNSRELHRGIKSARDRLERKLAGQKEELRKTENREQIRRDAELIKANIWRIHKGDRVLECENYYEPECPVVQIRLDPLKNPSQNSAALFKQYNKLKSAEQHLTVLITEAEEQLDYLNSVLMELDTASCEKDMQSIRAELTATGYLHKQRNDKNKAPKAQAPLGFLSVDGFEIVVGRNNLQNDELTFKQARRTDLWLHAQKIHGSHVIIHADGLDVPETTILQAAQTAAWFSQGREAGKVPVDYTQVRLVRKPTGALPGKVIYTEYKTILVEPHDPSAESQNTKR